MADRIGRRIGWALGYLAATVLFWGSRPFPKLRRRLFNWVTEEGSLK